MQWGSIRLWYELYKQPGSLLTLSVYVMVFWLAENKEKYKADILLLSIAANIVSRHTSMVGVDKDRKEKIVGEMIQRDVPLMTSRRFAGMPMAVNSSLLVLFIV